MNKLADADIIVQVIAGNKMLFTHLVDRYKAMAFTLAFRILGNREDAEETVQDAFVKVYEHLAEFRQKSKFSTWLYRIVYNTSITHSRKRKAAMQEMDSQTCLHEDTSRPDSLIYGFTEEEAGEFVRKILAFLSGEERTIITLYYLNESGIDEIHEITGLSKTNIKVKLFRARKKLQEYIGQVSDTVSLCSINVQ
jgi:RNA polymerase sigma factor (sigma-70 family)